MNKRPLDKIIDKFARRGCQMSFVSLYGNSCLQPDYQMCYFRRDPVRPVIVHDEEIVSTFEGNFTINVEEWACLGCRIWKRLPVQALIQYKFGDGSISADGLASPVNVAD